MSAEPADFPTLIFGIRTDLGRLPTPGLHCLNYMRAMADMLPYVGGRTNDTYVPERVPKARSA